MHLRINNSHRETKNYHGKIYIRKLLTYCNFQSLSFTSFFHKINLTYTPLSHNFNIFSNFFLYILII